MSPSGSSFPWASAGGRNGPRRYSTLGGGGRIIFSSSSSNVGGGARVNTRSRARTDGWLQCSPPPSPALLSPLSLARTLTSPRKTPAAAAIFSRVPPERETKSPPTTKSRQMQAVSTGRTTAPVLSPLAAH